MKNNNEDVTNWELATYEEIYGRKRFELHEYYCWVLAGIAIGLSIASLIIALVM